MYVYVYVVPVHFLPREFASYTHFLFFALVRGEIASGTFILTVAFYSTFRFISRATRRSADKQKFFAWNWLREFFRENRARVLLASKSPCAVGRGTEKPQGHGKTCITNDEFSTSPFSACEFRTRPTIRKFYTLFFLFSVFASWHTSKVELANY